MAGKLKESTTHHEDHLSTNMDDTKADFEKRESANELARVPTEQTFVTVKTWVVVWAMSLSYAASFWPAPFFSQIQSEMAVHLGATAGQGTWVTSCFITAVTIAFM